MHARHLLAALASLSALASIAAPAPETPAPEVAHPATPVFGGGIATPAGTFAPLLFERTWTSRGSVGELDADRSFAADGWHPFRLRTAARPDDAPQIRGRVRFAAASGGAVRAEWLATPTADADIAEFCIGSTVPFSAIGGGTALADGKEIAIPATTAPKPHLFRGAVSTLALRDRAGAELLRIAFDEPTRILLQDGRHWSGANLSLRLFFAEGPVQGGREYAVRATIATPAAGPLALQPGDPVRIVAGPDWLPLANEPWIEPGSALDFSCVVPHHAPAGAYGRVVAVGDHFELAGRPGVPQRFYGVYICGAAITPSTPEAADRFAANLARIGYNTLRIHHHERSLLAPDDMVRGRRIADVLADPQDFDDTVPDPDAMDRFDALVAACVRHGIYLTTDLFVSRSWYTTWRALGVDRDGCPAATSDYKVLCAFWEPAFSNLCAWSRNFLLHVNPYTGRSLADEPALACLALVNEGNLGNYGAAPLRSLPGVQEAWEQWLAARQADAEASGDAAAAAAWRDIPRTIPDDLYADDGDTPAHRHSAAFAIFLADKETALADRLRAFLRDELHCQAPLSSLSSWYNPVQYQLPRTGFDYVDDHFYVDHPSFLDRSWKLPSRCPNTNPMAGANGGARGVVFRRLAGKPFCLTEWNYAGPGRYRGVGGIATGVLGALQNWSGMWRFAWSHGRAGVEDPGSKTMGYFDMSGDPLGLAAERAALCLFLRGDIAPLKTSYPVVLSEAALRNPANGAPACRADWLWAAWNARLSVDVAKDGQAAAETGAPSPLANLGRTSDAVRADLAARGATVPGDGAVAIDSDTGTFLLDTPCTVGGFAEEGEHEAGALRFALSDAPATVWASSLDAEPVASSSHVLLTHLTDVQNSGIVYADPSLTILLDWGTLPHLMRRGAADVSLALAPGDWVVWRLSPSGRRLGSIPATYADGRLSFRVRTDIVPETASYVYELERR